MSVNKKSISTLALTEMDKIKKAIKEESKNTIKTMLSEAVKDVLRESVEDDDEDDMEIIDDEKKECCPECGKCGDKCKCGKKDADGKCDDKSCKKESGKLEEVGDEEEVPADDQAAQDSNAGDQIAQMAAMGQMDPALQGNANGQNAAMNAPEQGEGEDIQDDFAAQYQAGDEDTLDLTGEQDIQNVLKVYKSLSDDDQVVVRKEGDKISLQDNGTGAEYIIDLGTEDVETEEVPEVDGGEAEENNSIEEPEEIMENTLFEIDLGYTDNYQDKDPIDGLNNSEPSKSGRSVDAGIPTGTKKPWAGKGTEKKGEPFDNNVNEEAIELDDEYFSAGLNDTGVAEVETEDGMPFDERVDENQTTSKYQKRHKVKTRATNSGDKKNPEKSKSTSIENEYNAEINETIKKLKAKNHKLNEAVRELHKGLQEAYMTNVNLGKITKLFLECSTTQAEKINIVERFSKEAKTPKQAQALYESIAKQLSNSNKTTIDESKVTDKKTINENKTVYKSQDLLNTIDLMNRVLNC